MSVNDSRQRHVYTPHPLGDRGHCDKKVFDDGRPGACGRTRAEHMTAEEIAALPQEAVNGR